MFILINFQKYTIVNAHIAVFGLESQIYGYLKLTISFVKILFQTIQRDEVKREK